MKYGCIFCRLELLAKLTDNGKDLQYIEDEMGKSETMESCLSQDHLLFPHIIQSRGLVSKNFAPYSLVQKWIWFKDCETNSHSYPEVSDEQVLI